MRGALSPEGAHTRVNVDGMVNPDSEGLPPDQLQIGIMTILTATDAVPSAPQWGQNAFSPDLYRGFFGGNIPGDSPGSLSKEGLEWNGNIEFTNRSGGAIQDIFYDPAGDYYNFLCLYPYRAIEDAIGDPRDNNPAWRDDNGAKGYFKIDGNDDVMVSTGGKGNIVNPWGSDYATDPTDGTVTFRHKLTALRCKFVAENAVAQALYGAITSVKLLEQPNVVSIDLGEAFLDLAGTPLEDESENTSLDGALVSYPAVGSDGTTASAPSATTPLAMPAAYTAADAVEGGYMMALPAGSYTFEITTSGLGSNNPLRATYVFDATPTEGSIYNLTFTMRETAEIALTAAEAKEWWLNQTFD
jgi:hypothetical protein